MVERQARNVHIRWMRLRLMPPPFGKPSMTERAGNAKAFSRACCQVLSIVDPTGKCGMEACVSAHQHKDVRLRGPLERQYSIKRIIHPQSQIVVP